MPLQDAYGPWQPKLGGYIAWMLSLALNSRHDQKEAGSWGQRSGQGTRDKGSVKCGLANSPGFFCCGRDQACLPGEGASALRWV